MNGDGQTDPNLNPEPHPNPDPDPRRERLAEFLDGAINRLQRDESAALDPDEAFGDDPALVAEARGLLDGVREWLEAREIAAESSGFGFQQGDILTIPPDPEALPTLGPMPSPFPLPEMSPAANPGPAPDARPCSIGALNSTMPRLAGSRDRDRYQVVKRLGRGGCGEVYLVQDRYLPRLLAIKVIKPRISGADLEEALAALRQEAGVLGQLHHPNILTFHDWREFDSGPGLIMRYIEGGSLADRLRSEGRIPWPEAVEIALDVAEGLLEVHRAGLLHRDIKPANILWDAKTRTALLADFGVAGRLGASRGFAGTPLYAAPELFLPGGRATTRSDVYSLAVTLFELILGQRPFPDIERVFCGLPADDPRFLSLPEPVERAIRRGLALDVADRPDLPEFISLLTDALHGGMADDLVPSLNAGASAAKPAAFLRVWLSREEPRGSKTFHELRHQTIRRGAKLKRSYRDHLINGDLVRVEVEAVEAGWLALINLSPDGSTTLLHPEPGRPSAEPDLPAAQRRWIADIEMDDTPGEERFLFAWARDPGDLAIETLQRIAEQFNGAKIGGRREVTRGVKAIFHALRPSDQRDVHVVVAAVEHKEA